MHSFEFNEQKLCVERVAHHDGVSFEGAIHLLLDYCKQEDARIDAEMLDCAYHFNEYLALRRRRTRIFATRVSWGGVLAARMKALAK